MPAGRKQVGSISIKVTPDLDGFWGELKSKLESIEKALKGLIAMEPDLKGFREKVAAETKGMSADVKVKADLSQSDFLKTIEAVKAAAKAADTKINIDFKDKEAEAKLAGLIAKLKAEAKASDIKLKVDVDGDFAQRGAIAGLRALGGSALDSLGNVRAFGIGLTAMLGIASLVAPGLALVSGALLVLPGVAAGALAPIAALALGMDGFKRALDASGFMELVQGKTSKSGTKGKDKQSAGQVIKDAQKQIADVFTNGLTPVFTDLATKALPPLTQALKPVASGIVDVISQFSNMITAGPGLQNLSNIFTNMGTTLTNMAPGIASFGQGLLQLADKTVAKFPGLGKAFSDMGNEFAGWIDKITTPGANGISQFDSAMSNLKGTLAEIAGLGKDLFNWSFDNLKDPAFGNSMKDFAGTLRELIDTTLPAFNKAMEVVGLALKPITVVIDALKSLNDLTGGVLGKIARFATGGIGDAFGPAPDQANAAGQQAGLSFSDGLKSMLQGQGQGAVGQSLSGILPDPTQAGDAGQQAAQQFANNFQSVITGGGNLAPGGNSLFPGMPGFDPQSAVAVGQDVAKNFTDGFSNQLAAQPIPDVSGMLLGKSGDQGGNLQDLTGSIRAEIGSLAPEVQAAVDAASAPLSALTTQITATVSQAFNSLPAAALGGMQGMVGVVQGGSAQIVGIFLSLGPQIVGAVSSISGQMVSAGQAIGARLADGINAGAALAVAAMQNLAAAVQAQVPHSPAKEGPFSGAGWTALFTGGQAVAGQFSDGLEQGFQGVISRAQALAQSVADAMANGGQVGPGIADNIKQQLAAIKLESDQLRVQRDQASDPSQKKAIGDQLKQLGTVRDQLKLQEDQLGFSKKYGDQQDKNGQIIEDSLNKMVGIGVDFGKANFNQFMQDIGASGNGAVEKIADTGIGWATSMLGQLISGAFSGGGTTIQVQSPEDALQVKQTTDRRRQLQYAGR